MGEKDITEKLLEDYNDVFADIVNVLLFQGKQVIKEEDLENTKDKSQYKIDGKIHEQERDVSKFWKKGGVKIALCGLENQADIDKYMPMRVIGYDGAAYRSQLSKGNIMKQEKIKKNSQHQKYPVITLVLYYGTARWKKYRSLHECLEISKELIPYVNDYKINLFEIAYLTDEQVEMFQSDFKIVADYFVQKRKNDAYVPSSEKIKHVDEILKIMKVLTGDDTFEKVQGKEGSVDNMCELMARMKAENIEQGKKVGKEEGRIEGRIEAYVEVGLSIEEISEKLKMTVEKVEEVMKQIEENNKENQL